MSHFSVLVVLPPTEDPQATIADVITEDSGLLAEAMSLYDENREDAIAPKWDWWTIGGRWRGELAVCKGAPHWDVSQTRPRYPDMEAPASAGFCDAARVRSIDFEAMRDAAERRAAEAWDTYHRVVKGTPEPALWSDYIDRVNAAEVELFGMSWSDAVHQIYDEERARHLDYHGPHDDFWYWVEEQDSSGNFTETSAEYQAASAAIDVRVEALKARRPELSYDVDRARADYAAQPRVHRVRTSEEYRDSWFNDPVDRIGPWTRSEYLYRQRVAAVPGFATLIVSPEVEGKLAPTDTQWVAPGEMGWFGVSSATSETKLFYQEKINTLVDGLSPEHVIVMLDCHI